MTDGQIDTAILDHLRSHDAQTAAQIVEATGLSADDVMASVARMTDERVIKQSGEGSSAMFEPMHQRLEPAVDQQMVGPLTRPKT